MTGVAVGGFGLHPVQSQHGPAREAALGLALGEPARAGKDQVTVPVDFSPAQGERVGQIQVEITFPDGPWRFRKVEVYRDSSLKSSARRRQEEKPDSRGSKHRVNVILLSFFARRNAISGGEIAQLYFSLERPDASISIPLTIRSFQTAPPEAAREAPILEPPPVDPPMNPAPTCFFFAH